jgi:hypothetical protein
LIGALLFVIVIILAVLWPRHVMFSYGGKTCFYQPTIAPGLLRSQSDRFRLKADRQVSVAGVTLAALNMCIVPIKAPEKGVTTAALSLTGLPWLQKQYLITTPDPPIASVHVLGKQGAEHDGTWKQEQQRHEQPALFHARQRLGQNVRE